MKPHTALNAGTATSPSRGLEKLLRIKAFPPYPGSQSGRPTSDQQGILPARGTDVSPGVFPCVGLPPRVPGETPVPRRAVPGARPSGLGWFPAPHPCAPPTPSRRQQPPHGARPDPKDAQKAPNPPVPLSLCSPPPRSQAAPAPVSRAGLWAPRSWGSQLEWDGEGGGGGSAGGGETAQTN